MFFYYGFNKLNFFNLFCEYFIGIMVIFLLVVFIVLISNIYGLLISNVAVEILAFCLFLSGFFLLQDYYLIIQQNNLLLFNGFSNFLTFSQIAIFSKFVLIFFSTIFLFIISKFLFDYNITSFEYVVVLLCAIIGVIFLCCTNDFLSSFLAIELISFSSYILTAFRKMSSFCLESAIKYLIIGALSSAFFLLGSSMIYGFTGVVTFSYLSLVFENFTFSFENIFHFFVFYATTNLTKQNFYYQFFLNLAIVFIVLSIFVKLALAPFHLWSIEIYEAAPTISTFFFSILTKLSFFIFLYKFCFLTFYNIFNFWLFYICIAGFFSIFVGCLGGIKQKKLKTLLAYSSISHMGYLILTFANFSKLGFEIFFFYIICYIISNIVVWYIILALKKITPFFNNKLSKNLGDFVLISKSHSFLALSLTLAFFSLAGIPPLIGFLVKFNVFLLLAVEKFYILSIFLLLCSILSTFYYIRVVKILYFENALTGSLYYFNTKNIILLNLCLFLLIFLFFNPTLLYLIIHNIFF